MLLLLLLIQETENKIINQFENEKFNKILKLFIYTKKKLKSLIKLFNIFKKHLNLYLKLIKILKYIGENFRKKKSKMSLKLYKANYFFRIYMFQSKIRFQNCF